MRTGTGAIREHEIGTPDLNWERVKEWAKRAFSRERIAEATVATATVVVLGYVGAFVCQVAQSY